MDLSYYKIQEVFQSSTLRERKRNLRRQMEEYIGTMLRCGGRNWVTTDTDTNCVAAPEHTPYNTDERSRNK